MSKNMNNKNSKSGSNNRQSSSSSQNVRNIRNRSRSPRVRQTQNIPISSLSSISLNRVNSVRKEKTSKSSRFQVQSDSDMTESDDEDRVLEEKDDKTYTKMNQTIDDNSSDVLTDSSEVLSDSSDISESDDMEEKYDSNGEPRRIPNNKKIIIWARVSSRQQQEGMSLEMQEEECKKYLKRKGLRANIILKNIGSAYNRNASIWDEYETLGNYRNSTIICYSVCRFSRNVEEGTSIYNRLKRNGCNIIFINENINTDNRKDEQKFFKQLQEAENESHRRSQRQIDNYQFRLQQNINDSSEDLKYIKKIIHYLIDGGNVDKINRYFRKIVDWRNHPEWKEDYYENPIDFGEDNLTIKGNKTYLNKDSSTFRTIANLLNQYDIKIPIRNIRNIYWSERLIRTIYETNFDDLNQLNERLRSFNM